MVKKWGGAVVGDLVLVIYDDMAHYDEQLSARYDFALVRMDVIGEVIRLDDSTMVIAHQVWKDPEGGKTVRHTTVIPHGGVRSVTVLRAQ